MRATRLQALVLAAATLVAPGRARAEPSTRLEQVRAQLDTAEESLQFVETQYTSRPERSEEDAHLQRFSHGEIQYLLGDWANAATLFYDLVSDPGFRAHPRFAEALFYLSDSLHQQRNHVGARLYLRELLELPDTRRYQEALVRYLEIAGKLNQFTGLDGYLERARRLAGGKLPPELAYVHARWLFKRTDLPEVERRARAREAFTPLATPTPAGPLQRRAAYFLGVLSVQEGDYAGAVERFRALTDGSPEDPEVKRLAELANLSMGRLLYELGRYDEALDRYGRIARDSESFVDSLYELAWVHVKKGDLEQAKNATDILLLMAPDSPLAPEARILQGHLQLKLRRYDEATSSYEEVIGTYQPVREKLDALLRVDQDPVAYFDDLLARNERNLDITTLLPPLALRYATSQKQVEDAVRMAKDLESSRQGVEESRAIVTRILQALDERALEVFPELQEGYVRAESVDSALARVEQQLVQLEGEVLSARLTAEERTRLEEVRREREALRERFSSLPATQQEVEARRERMRARVEELDREAYLLNYELQSMNAAVTAMRKWVADTREQRDNTPEEEQQFLARLSDEEEAMAALRLELGQLRARLQDEHNSPNTFVSGEELIRARYREVLQREHALLASFEGRLSGDEAGLVERTHQVRTRADTLRSRVELAKQVLRAQVERRGRLIRDKVLAEQRLLRSYHQEVASVSGDARNLVGRIAYESFQKVRQRFYDLLLKADVGLVDVAFTRKQDRTGEVQKLSAQKDGELRAMEEEFEEVLKEEK